MGEQRFAKQIVTSPAKSRRLVLSRHKKGTPRGVPFFIS
jgi:hypothetical protein